MTFVDRGRNGGPQRICKTDKAEEVESDATWGLGNCKVTRQLGARNAEHAHTLQRHLVDCAGQVTPVVRRKITQAGNGFWCALYRGYQDTVAIALPDIGDGEQVRSQPVFPFEQETAMRRLRRGKRAPPEGVK